jgi:phosphatidylglycerol---prolipoprotein diacylglyceryl transferase
LLPSSPPALAFPNIDPVILEIGPLAIHWYGVAYIAGILFGWWYSKRLVSNPRLWTDGQAPMKPIDLDDLVTWATVGIIMGGRLGYVLFYNPAHYFANPFDIIAIWDGGMSFHGGFLGTTVAMIVYARARGIPVWSLFDVIAASVPVAFGLVRITNFINAELWGRPTDVPWGVVFCNERIASLPANGGICPAGLVARHPSQLYEAVLDGLVLFILLRLLTHVFLKLKRPGFVAGAFVAWYGLARILVEFFREPDRQLGYLSGGWLTMGMMLSLPMVLAGVWAMATARPAVAPANA